MLPNVVTQGLKAGAELAFKLTPASLQPLADHVFGSVIKEQFDLDEGAKYENFGVLAEFDTAAEIFTACEGVRDEGYTVWDSYTPFPVHNLDKAMGLKASKVGWVSAFLGVCGATTGFLMQTFTHGGFPQWLREMIPLIDAWDYPLVISGKPFFAWPTYVPITFEFGVISGVVGALLAMLAFNQLPRWYHSLFKSERFAQVTDDKFFIAIECRDPKFDADATASLLEKLGATHVELVER